MKNLIFLGLFFALSSLVFSQEKQITKQPNPENVGIVKEKHINMVSSDKYNIEANFFGKDLNGVEHDIQSYLDSGKHVLIDISAVNCGPCWKLHQSHILKVLHNKYGPNGTNEVVVLFFEGANSPIEAIKGNGSGSLGDWTDAGSVPYPIILDSRIKSVTPEFDGYPYLALISPDGLYLDIWNVIYDNLSPSAANAQAEKIINLVRGFPEFENKLIASPTNLSFNATGGEEAFKITSSVNWKVSKKNNWITISQDSGSNDGSVTVTLAANSSTKSRTGQVAVLDKDNNIKKFVAIYQEGTATSIINNDLPQFSIYPNPAKEVLNIDNAEGANIIVTNTIGQVLSEIEFARNFEQINTSSFEAGTYFVKFLRDGCMSNYKVVILK